MQGLQRREWQGTRQELGVCFRLTKGKRQARCVVCNHPTKAWELRLTVDDELIESQAFTDQDDLIAVVTEWRTRLINAGWQEPPAIVEPVSTCTCAEGWVCEEHKDRPMGHDGCGGAGQPCANEACQAGVTLRHQLAARRLIDTNNKGGAA
jgi:hypothetical protein